MVLLIQLQVAAENYAVRTDAKTFPAKTKTIIWVYIFSTPSSVQSPNDCGLNVLITPFNPESPVSSCFDLYGSSIAT